MSTRPDGLPSSDLDAIDEQTHSDAVEATITRGQTTAGSLFLYVAVTFVVGISVGALMGKIDPVAGAVIVLGAEVLGTIAFFLTYYIGSRLKP